MSILKMRQSFGLYLKPILVVILVGFVVTGIWTTYGTYTGEEAGDRRAARGAVAVVNGQEIKWESYNEALWRFDQQARSQGHIVSVTEMARQKGGILDQLIDQQLRLQAASSEGIKVDKKQVRAKIDELIEEQLDMQRTLVAGDREMSDREIDRELSRMPNPTSLRKLAREMRKMINEDAVRAQLLIDGLEEKLDARIGDVSDEEWMDSYKQVRARHILVGTDSRPEDQAQRRAEEVLNKIKEGGNFEELAKEFSDDPGSKDNGGDLGFFGKGMMVPEFEKVAFDLKSGEISDVVKSDFGFHIIRVEETRTDLPPDFEENKETLREEFVAQHVNRKKSEYFQDLRADAKIEVRDPELQGYMALQEAYRTRSAEERDKKLVEAIRAYERATKADPRNHTAWVMLADIHMQRDQKDEALKIYENLLEGRSPIEDAELRMRLGQLYMQEEKNDEAVEQFEIAGDVGYANMMIQYQLSSLYQQLERQDLAEKTQERIEEMTRRMQEQQMRMAPPAPEPEEPESEE